MENLKAKAVITGTPREVSDYYGVNAEGISKSVMEALL